MYNKHSSNSTIRSIAIVGSGLAGLTAGILLKAQGHSVTLFEKSRGPGGRLSVKRVSGTSVDMGGQYFTARNPEFLPFLRQHAGADAIATWQGDFGYQQENGEWSDFPQEERHVGAPRMTAITRGLSQGLDVKAQTRVAKMWRNEANSQWQLFDTEQQDLGAFDQVIITEPPAQAQELLADSSSPELARELDTAVAQILPCWAVAARYGNSPWQRFQGMRVANSPLFWVANNTSKPGRKTAESDQDAGEWWVLHATPEWTAAHVDNTPDQVANALVEAFAEVTGSAETPIEVLTHRWLYARSDTGDEAHSEHLWFASEQLGLAGDWLAGGRVEGAFNSATSLVAAISAAAKA